MGQTISLTDYGIRLFACRLYNHDYLWFSSYEISKLSTTLPLIHNYALSYSMGDFSYRISKESSPHYEEDMAHISIYATPALATLWSRTRMTYNAINERTRGTNRPDGINSPDVGWRDYLDPVYATFDLEAQQLGFDCYLFSFSGQPPKGVTRLGKKGAVVRVRWKEIERAIAVFREELVRPTHPLNPLDLSGQVNSYEPISIPPHLLLRTAEVRNDWFIFAGSHRVHVPKRVIKRCQA